MLHLETRIVNKRDIPYVAVRHAASRHPEDAARHCGTGNDRRSVCLEASRLMPRGVPRRDSNPGQYACKEAS